MIRIFIALHFIYGMSHQCHASPEWLAFGELRGYYEPCGCDPSSDLGGVERLGAFLQRERVLHPKALVLNLGNNLPIEKNHRYKDRFILDAMKRLKADAYLYQVLEQKISRSDLPFVLSNSKERIRGVQDVIEKNGTAIYGFVSPDLRPGLRPAGETWKKKTKSKTSLLLFAGSDAELARLVPQFDVIVSANTHSLETTVALQEKNDPFLLFRKIKDKEVLSVPLGGQGVIRSAGLRSQTAPSLQNILGHSTSVIEPQGSTLLFGEARFVSWLDRSYSGISTQFADLSRDFAKASSDIFGAIEKEKSLATGSSRFAGAETCKNCHASAHEVWKASKHAQAWATLEKVKQDRNPECVQCHVVGYEEKDGFASPKKTPHLANVQCENCHGPSRAHSENPAAHKPQRQGDCRECHVGNHSPKFEYEAYWKQIFHKN